MYIQRVGRIYCIFLLALFLAVGTASAANPGYDKGYADGKAFGMRKGEKKGYDDGFKKGSEDGHSKGMADAEAGIDNGTPPPAPNAEAPPPEDVAVPQSKLDVEEGTETPAPAQETPEPAQETPTPTQGTPAPTQGTPAPTQETGVSSEEMTDNDGSPPSEGKVKSSTISSSDYHGESLSEEALRLYPDLLPKAPSLEGVSEEVVSDPPEQRTDIAGALVGENGLIDDEDIAYGTEYSKGFALGYLEGYKLTYSQAYDKGYEKGFAEGYEKGQLEYKELHYGADGELLTPQEQYAKGRSLLMQEKWEDGITRFNLVVEAGYDNEWVDDALYWKAWACYNTEQFSRAINTVSQMLEVLSDSDLADDALYCKGMCYEYLQTGGFLGIGVKKHYLEAAECFYNVIACYPSSPIVPNAYYKLGYNYERLGDEKAAIKAYRVILSQYPNSTVAFKAQRRLHALGAWEGDITSGKAQ